MPSKLETQNKSVNQKRKTEVMKKKPLDKPKNKVNKKMEKQIIFQKV